MAMDATADGRSGVEGCRRAIPRDNSMWFYDYALQPVFSKTPCSKGLFRVRKDFYDRIFFVLSPRLEKKVTRYQKPVEPERVLAAFLMYRGNTTCAQVGSQLGLGAITVPVFVKEVFRLLCKHF